eukprot:scaffold4327_cov47-Phaeocystis_antarctica.AAC.1
MQKPNWTLGARHVRRAHRKYAAHVRDAGRVETQWLVESTRALPSHTRGRIGAACGAKGGRAWGGGGTSSVQKTNWTLGARHARRAHRKHAAHIHGAGRVEIQRLVESTRALPRHTRRRIGAACGARGGRAWGGGGTSSVQKTNWTLGARHARRAHQKHVSHVRGAGRVETQRL